MKAGDSGAERLPGAVQAKEAWQLKASDVLALTPKELRCV
jgi:hypothetical protein